MKATIYHNPRCSKSRKTLELLRQHDIDVDVIEYLNSPPSKEELKTMIKMLGIMPIDLVRKNESVFKERFSDDLSDNKLINAMIEEPILIERPIVVVGDRAVLGRPPENVLSLLE